MREITRFALAAAVLLLGTGCPPGPSSRAYNGESEVERKLLHDARRDVYPDDVREDLESYRKATLAWPGIVVSSKPDPKIPSMAMIVIEHHYWDWIEDHSIQKAKAFLSPRGEGQFVCHAELATLPKVALARAMAIAYARPVGIKDGQLHAACLVQFHAPDWYATDVFDYGRNGEGLKILRVPME